MNLGIQKIVSGGQTGVDRAALDYAISAGIPHGGWIPRGRLTEDGPLDVKYQLTETKSKKYEVRTEKNVQDSDGTLILFSKILSGGTLLTHQMAAKLNKPVFLVNLMDDPPKIEPVQQWILRNKIKILNVAGPRLSKVPKIDQDTFHFLKILFQPTPK